jgi:threonine aldolase
MTPIDLRSDTVTRPTDAMRAAMAAAPVGDDQYGEDPTTNRLQQRCAELLGKEQALWLPSGTMANQVALRVLTRPGDEVVAGRECHAAWHEAGGAAANSGVQIVEVGEGGVDQGGVDPAARPLAGHGLLQQHEAERVEVGLEVGVRVGQVVGRLDHLREVVHGMADARQLLLADVRRQAFGVSDGGQEALWHGPDNRP